MLCIVSGLLSTCMTMTQDSIPIESRTKAQVMSSTMTRIIPKAMYSEVSFNKYFIMSCCVMKPNVIPIKSFTKG